MWKESLQHQRESLGDRVSEARGMKRLAQKLVIGLLMLRKEGLEKLQLRWNSGSFEENCELIFSKFCMKPPLELMIFFFFFPWKRRGRRWWIEWLGFSILTKGDHPMTDKCMRCWCWCLFPFLSFDFALDFWSSWLESLKGWCFFFFFEGKKG